MTPIPPSITTGISNYEEAGYGDPVHRMKALTWQAPNKVNLCMLRGCLNPMGSY